MRYAVAAMMVFVTCPRAALAGMPAVNLTDMARMRLNGISFFVAGFLLSAWALKWIWNSLQRDFPRMPRLTYKSSAGIVFLWGIFFVLVLTMISGARELMTPGAWEKQGYTYKLKPPELPSESPAVDNGLITARENSLDRLYRALLQFAARHEGRFPAADEVTAIDAGLWNLPERTGMRYEYRPGRTVDDPSVIVAFEPDVYDDGQLTLTTGGSIQRISPDGLALQAPAETSP